MGVDCSILDSESQSGTGGLESEHETEEARGTHILRWSPKKVFFRVDIAFVEYLGSRDLCC